jgi:hypothetical protein
MGLFNINCDKASHICDKSQYNEASLLDVLMLKTHLLFCKVCRYHSRKNCLLTKRLKSTDIHILDDTSKAKMEEKLQTELSKQQR